MEDLLGIVTCCRLGQARRQLVARALALFTREQDAEIGMRAVAVRPLQRLVGVLQESGHAGGRGERAGRALPRLRDRNRPLVEGRFADPFARRSMPSIAARRAIRSSASASPPNMQPSATTFWTLGTGVCPLRQRSNVRQWMSLLASRRVRWRRSWALRAGGERARRPPCRRRSCRMA